MHEEIEHRYLPQRRGIRRIVRRLRLRLADALETIVWRLR